MKPFLLIMLGSFLCSPMEVFAIGQTRYVSSFAEPGSFALAQKREATSIYVDPQDWPGVIRAAGDLQSDIARVTNAKPAILLETTRPARNAVIIGTIGKSRIIDDLIRAGEIDGSRIAGKWESFLLQVVRRPQFGNALALVIAGSDKRGTIFGIYDLSEQIGVSPLHWWADVPVQHRNALFIKAGTYVQGPPSVKYRGIFLNDESPDLSGWIAEKHGTVPVKLESSNSSQRRQL